MLLEGVDSAIGSQDIATPGTPHLAIGAGLDRSQLVLPIPRAGFPIAPLAPDDLMPDVGAVRPHRLPHGHRPPAATAFDDCQSSSLAFTIGRPALTQGCP